MKPKNIVALVSLGLVLIIIGNVLVNKIGRSGQPRTAEVEIVQPIDPSFSTQARDILIGRVSQVPTKNFSSPPDLSQGFGNTNPFKAQ